jgi:hypothetical protein
MAGVTDPRGNVDAISVHYPNDQLVSTIIRAWNDSAFKDRLLTYPHLGEQNWGERGDPDYGKTREALAEMGVFIDKPVVLTCEQYDLGYQKKDCDVIYVLPVRPSAAAGRHSIATARTAMQFCIFGM